VYYFAVIAVLPVVGSGLSALGATTILDLFDLPLSLPRHLLFHVLNLQTRIREKAARRGARPGGLEGASPRNVLGAQSAEALGVTQSVLSQA
jgi:hypothetical protein